MLRRLILLGVAFGLALAVVMVWHMMLTNRETAVPAVPDIHNSGAAPLGMYAASAYTLHLPLTMKNHDASYVSPFGISMFGPVDDAAGLTKMKEAGAGWVMTTVDWREIQPVENGPYNWSAHDAKFANATAAGMRLFVLFSENPAWVTTAPRGPVPDDKLPALENVVRAMAERYNGSQGYPRIDYWSFYGEPDNQSAWGHHGTEFADMLARIAPIIYTANPNAKVLIGGLAYDRFTDESGIFVRSFLADVLQRLNTSHGGAAQYIDAVAFHFYPISTARWPTIREKAQEVREIMTQYGVGHLPLIVPEMSMWSDEWNGSDERLQAQRLVQFFVQGLSFGIQQLYWFQVVDILPPFPSSAQGLFRGHDLTQPKEADFAYTVLTRELDQAQYFSGLNIAGAEGYVFRRGGSRITVVWGASATPVFIDFAQTCARKVSLLGSVSLIYDGGPGDLDATPNGSLRLSVTQNEPIYVTECP